MINIFDLHNDYFTELKNNKQKTKYIKKCKKQNVSNVLSAVWTSKMSECEALDNIRKAREFAEKNCLKFAIEDLHFCNRNNLNHIIQMNPEYIGLTWNYENKLACGSLEYGGMTKLGVKIAKKIEESNIQIDTAHLNESSFLTFSNLTQKPILCSHTAVHTLTNNPRNLKDYQIKIIEEYKGIIGLCFVKDFITKEKRCNINDLLNHITYFTNKFSIKCLCIGSDFYGTKNLPKGIKNYKSLNKIQSKLTTYGFSNNAIRKIYYKNADRFFKENI